MTSLFSIPCDSEVIAASLDGAMGRTGIVMVIGGGQTRIGAHRGFLLLSRAIAAAGYPALRYDRRGVGDSSGVDPGFEASAPDLAAAVTAFRERCPTLERIVGFGLCDGATTLCLHHAGAGIDAMILANPWVVEAEANEPPPAAIGKHYREQMMSFDGWRRALTGGIDYRKAVRGVMKLVKPAPKDPGNLVERTAAALMASDAPAEIVLAADDATAIAFDHEWRKGGLKALAGEARYSLSTIDTDAHSFAREGDFEQLVEICLAAIRRFANA